MSLNIRRSNRFVACLVLLAACASTLAQPTAEPDQRQRRPARMLSLGSQRGQAIKDYEAVYEQYLAWCNLPADQRRSTQQRPERDQIVEEYRALIERYPRTEVAGMARVDILELYGASDDMIAADSAYHEVLESLAFTEYEMDAHTYLGLVWLQRKGSPAQAMKYFQAIPDPRNTPYRLVMPGGTVPSKPGELRPEERLYVRAQTQVLRCLVRQRRLDEAEKARANLVAAYPEVLDAVDRSMWKMKVEEFNLPVEARGSTPGGPSYSGSFNVSDIPEEPWNPQAKELPTTPSVPRPASSSLPAVPAAAAPQRGSAKSWLFALAAVCLLLAGGLEIVRQRIR